jgi:transposase-like protein
LNIRYALSDLERALAISLRTSSWVSIDEVWENLLEVNPKISRSSVYRCFVKENIHQIPQEKKEKAKKFKEYEPGYLHIDVTYLPKFNGKSCYLFVAIDRCTRAMFYWIYENKTAESTEDFMDKCIVFFPFKITHILTDNGLEFTNRLLKSKTGNACQKPSKMDIKCKENNIVHAEIMFDPQTHTHRGISFETVIMGIQKAREQAKVELGISSVLIMSYLRHLSEEEAFVTLEQSLPFKKYIKAVGLDSSELGNPPSKFKKVFEKVYSNLFDLIPAAARPLV